MASGTIESPAVRKHSKLQAAGIRGLVDINKKILGKLQEWQQKEGSLPQYLELYKNLLLIQVESKPSVPSTQPALNKSKISATLKKGIPLLKWDALHIDWPTFQKLSQAAAAAIGEHIEPRPQNSKGISSDIPSLQEAARAWYEGSSLLPWASRYGIEEEVFAAMIHCAIKPFLTAQAKAITGLIDHEEWRRRYCPVCGGKPDFAFLDKELGARWLLCSRCDTQWLFQRLECPYCGTTNQNELAYFTDDKELYRLYTCQKCHTYLKAIDLRKTESDVLLPLERVMTVDMDRQGQEKGYKGG